MAGRDDRRRAWDGAWHDVPLRPVISALICVGISCVIISLALVLAPTQVAIWVVMLGSPLAVWAVATAIAPRNEVSQESTSHTVAEKTSAPEHPSTALATMADSPVAPVATSEVAPSSEPTPAAPVSQAASTLDLKALSERLADSTDPIADLKLVVGDIRTREAHAAGIASQPYPDELAPCGLELFLARALEEAGLFSKDVDLPAIHVVRPHRSGMFYLRIEDESYPYLAKVRTIQVESALNRTLFASLCVADAASATIEECYEAAMRIQTSITAQIPPEDSLEGKPPEANQLGEWSARQALAVGIESFRLPFRLETEFRVNVAERQAAFEIDLTPAEAFPASVYSGELERIIPTTTTMRAQQATNYGLLLGILLAAHAFRCSDRLSHVHVAGIVDNARTHRCFFSVDFDRRSFQRLRLDDIGDPIETYRSLGATLDVTNGVLEAVTQDFSLDEERFCPSRRYESVDLSDRVISGIPADELHARRVADLAIHEEARRERVADDIVRLLSDSTEKNVRVILNLTRNDPDPTVHDAANRTVAKLIDGTLADGNALGIEKEFVSGDALSRGVESAVASLTAHDAATAQKILAHALDPIDSCELYEDEGTTTWRYFSSYVSRALYNRLLAHEGEQLHLVPDAYLEAHLLMANALLLQEDAKGALVHAKRAMKVAPMDSRGYLRAVRANENMADWQAAISVLCDLLRVAHDPECLGVAYYRLAFMEWQCGNLLAARACYHRSIRYSSSCQGLGVMELRTLETTTGATDDLDSLEKVDNALAAHDIPLAPTTEVSDALVACAEATTDAEIFPVARNFATLLGALSGDDVMTDIMRSIEAEPDR